MICPFCDDKRKIPIDEKKVDSHLIIAETAGKPVHVHGPLNDPAKIKLYVDLIMREAGLSKQAEIIDIEPKKKR